MNLLSFIHISISIFTFNTAPPHCLTKSSKNSDLRDHRINSSAANTDWIDYAFDTRDAASQGWPVVQGIDTVMWTADDKGAAPWWSIGFWSHDPQIRKVIKSLLNWDGHFVFLLKTPWGGICFSFCWGSYPVSCSVVFVPFRNALCPFGSVDYILRH